jgi:predicted membrane channel-forming protein YqfA (hemolysin III family)
MFVVVDRDDARVRRMAVPFIETGYRLPSASVWDCLFTGVCRCHNETACVHSHLWPAAYLLCLACTSLCKTLPELVGPSWRVSERLAWLYFFVSAVLCFASSAVFHSLLSHDDDGVRHLAHRIDYVGIQNFIGATNVLAFFLGFECFPRWQALYLAISITLLVVGVGLQVFGNWAAPAFRRHRLILFAASALLGVLPLLQWKFVLTGGRASDATTIFGDILSFYAYFGTAFAFFISRWPERTFRRWPLVDLCFSSHVLWHLFTAVAAIHFAHSVLRFREYRAEFGCSHELDNR